MCDETVKLLQFMVKQINYWIGHLEHKFDYLHNGTTRRKKECSFFLPEQHQQRQQRQWRQQMMNRFWTPNRIKSIDCTASNDDVINALKINFNSFENLTEQFN